MSNKKSIRDAIFAENNRKPASKVIEIFGQEVEVRQPSLAQIHKLGKAAAANDKVPPFIRILTEYTYVPGTDEHVFEPTDADTLAAMPAGDWMNKLNTAIEQLTGVDVKAAEKNSEETD